MRKKDKGIYLWRYWPLWSLHFGLHLLLGIVGIVAGIVVVMQGQFVNGLALAGAAIFAVVNGWTGYKELWKSKRNRLNAT